MRTEEQILKEFKNLHYDIIENNNYYLKLNSRNEELIISKILKCYKSVWRDSNSACIVDIIEHILLHELFKIWGWIE